MSNQRLETFLFHYSPPPDIVSQPLLLLLLPNAETRLGTLEELAACETPLVTYSFELLVDWLRQSDLPLPRQVIDVGLAKKLAVGRPKSEFERRRPWDPWELLAPYLPDEDKTRLLRYYFSTHLTSPFRSPLENLRIPERILRALPPLWGEIQLELEERGEYTRFFDIEMPVYNTLLRSQYLGICIDEDVRDCLLIEVDQAHVSAHHKLTIKHGLNVEKALKGAEYLQSILGLDRHDTPITLSTDKIIGLNKGYDERCNLLHEVSSARRNMAILNRTFSQFRDRCFPVFDIMGTVSGRIQVVDPQLQHLKKRYRSVVIPRAGSRLLYVDYNQFEPTIMANMSGDEALAALCADGDLYVALAKEMLRASHKRKEAKRLFLAYSYGMNSDGLAELVHQTICSEKTTTHPIVDRLMKLFSGVERWRERLHRELREHGKVSTAFGNSRYRASGGPLNLKESRWAVNHVVQGTGALILKKLILRISSLLPEVNILLPMHDALLLEIPQDVTEIFVQNVIEECRQAFLEVCPGLAPRVSIEPFAKTV